MQALASRLRDDAGMLAIGSGWSRPVRTVCANVGVFLDPPMPLDGRDMNLYNHENDVSAVREWAFANGDNPGIESLCAATRASA